MPEESLWGLIVSMAVLVIGLIGKVSAQKTEISKLTKEYNACAAELDMLKRERDKRSNVEPASAGSDPARRRSVWDPDWRPTRGR